MSILPLTATSARVAIGHESRTAKQRWADVFMWSSTSLVACTYSWLHYELLSWNPGCTDQSHPHAGFNHQTIGPIKAKTLINWLDSSLTDPPEQYGHLQLAMKKVELRACNSDKIEEGMKCRPVLPSANPELCEENVIGPGDYLLYFKGTRPRFFCAQQIPNLLPSGANRANQLGARVAHDRGHWGWTRSETHGRPIGGEGLSKSQKQWQVHGECSWSNGCLTFPVFDRIHKVQDTRGFEESSTGTWAQPKPVCHSWNTVQYRGQGYCKRFVLDLPTRVDHIRRPL